MNVMVRLKAYQRIPIILAIFILLAPPLFFAQNLATACNFFHQKGYKPSGPCGHKALSPKANPFEAGMELTSSPAPENPLRLCVLAYFSDLFVLASPQPNSLPLRC